MSEDADFMRRAIELARRGEEEGEVPVGAYLDAQAGYGQLARAA